MNQLKRIIKDRPNASKVDLSFCQLDEIESIMGELYQLKSLQTVPHPPIKILVEFVGKQNGKAARRSIHPQRCKVTRHHT
jgi:hypothetical protein